jgi:hypothetical protein
MKLLSIISSLVKANILLIALFSDMLIVETHLKRQPNYSSVCYNFWFEAPYEKTKGYEQNG